MLFQIVCVGLVLVAKTSAQESCQFSRGVQGVCRDIRQCPRVLQDLQSRVKFPIICRTEGRYPIVCCPSDGSTDPTLVDISEPEGFSNCGSRPITGSPLIGDVRSARSVVGTLVVGGTPSQRGSWPWMALLGFREPSGNIDWFCAGVLINNNWVLTAAHCPDTRTVNVIRLGEHDYENDQDGANHADFDIETPIRHPEYKHPEAYHDLALIKLKRRVNYRNNIQPVCLPWGFESNENLEGKQVILTGWGDTIFGGSRSNVLQEVRVTVFPSADCDRSYQSINDYNIVWPNGIGSESICSGDRDGGKDACQGDSGGPIVSRDSKNRYTVAGIVSVGYGCGSADYPGLYVNLRRPEYLAWIRKVAF